jgi:hypothetical protein
MNLIKIFSRICAKTEGELVRVPTKKDHATRIQ